MWVENCYWDAAATKIWAHRYAIVVGLFSNLLTKCDSGARNLEIIFVISKSRGLIRDLRFVSFNVIITEAEQRAPRASTRLI